MVSFDKWINGVDTIFIGIEYASSKVRAETLCPYSTKTIKEAMSFNSAKKRIKLIDSAILKCMKF